MISQEIELVVPVGPSDHLIGPADATVTLVEYGDYECPYCGEAFLVIQNILKESEGLRLVFRNFPITTAHPFAERAAEAAEAAGAQGRFWEMHDILYNNQEALDDEHLLRYAAELGLDQGSFAEALRDGRFRDHIRCDFMGGVRSGVNGTPTFFIDGRRYTGAIDRVSLMRAISTIQAAF